MCAKFESTKTKINLGDGGLCESAPQLATALNLRQGPIRPYAGRPLFLTRQGAKKLERRRALFIAVAILKRHGFSKTSALRKLGISPVTFWRWEKRGAAPLTAYCGRRSAMDGLRISDRVIRQIQMLQIRGLGNAAAWRRYCSYPDAPPALARFARARSIPPSLLAATRLRKVSGVMLAGLFGAVFQPDRREKWFGA
jgi:predicted DNA-binding transcriptional regulator AlpA